MRSWFFSRVALVLEDLASGRVKNIDESVARLGGGADVDKALVERARVLVNERAEFVRARGKESVGPLMGVLMKEFRGKVDGQQVSRTLEQEVERFLSN